MLTAFLAAATVAAAAACLLATLGTGMAPPGPARRATGDPTDARADDPGYRELGFEPVVEQGGDMSARWRVWLAEAEAALDLAGRAGEVTTAGDGSVEAPAGPRSLAGSAQPADTRHDIVVRSNP